MYDSAVIISHVLSANHFKRSDEKENKSIRRVLWIYIDYHNSAKKEQGYKITNN
jgi:hypothetical protein